MDLQLIKEDIELFGVFGSKKVELEHKKFQIEATCLDLESRSSIEKQTMALYTVNDEYKQTVDKLTEVDVVLAQLKVTVPYLLRIAELESVTLEDL